MATLLRSTGVMQIPVALGVRTPRPWATLHSTMAQQQTAIPGVARLNPMVASPHTKESIAGETHTARLARLTGVTNRFLIFTEARFE